MIIAHLDEKQIKVLDGNLRLEATLQSFGEATVLLNGKIETVVKNESGQLEIKADFAFGHWARKLNGKDTLPRGKYFRNLKR